jgi:hypothetical protein
MKQEMEDAKRDARCANEELQQAKLEVARANLEGQQAKLEAQQTLKRAELAESAAAAAKLRAMDRIQAAETRAVAAERIAVAAQENVGRALGAFQKMADFGLTIIQHDEENLAKLALTKKFLIANEARIEKYGVQIIREDAGSRHKDAVRYSLLEGTESSIKKERDARPFKLVGEFIPTIDPDKLHSAFIEGGKAFVNCSPDQHQVHVFAKSKRRRMS